VSDPELHPHCSAGSDPVAWRITGAARTVKVLVLLGLGGCELTAQPGDDFVDPGRAWAPPDDPTAEHHPVDIHTTAAPGGLVSDERSSTGEPLVVPCAICHSPETGTSLASIIGPEARAHADVDMDHGDLTCGSCHSQGTESLHLADGQDLGWKQTMDLCSQCHGNQRRDYDHGSHGGMTGYWNLKQGPRSRNECVDCHAPHSPQMTPVLPVLTPRDRFLPPGVHG